MLLVSGCSQDAPFEFVDRILGNDDEVAEDIDDDKPEAKVSDMPTVDTPEEEPAEVLSAKAPELPEDEVTRIFNLYLDTGFYDHYVFENYEVLINVSKLIVKYTDGVVTDEYGRPEVTMWDMELTEDQYIKIMEVISWRSEYPDFAEDKNLGEALFYYKYENEYGKFAHYISVHDPKQWSWIIKEMNGYEYAIYPWGVTDYYKETTPDQYGKPRIVDYDTYADMWDYYTIGWLLPFDDTEANYIVYERLIDNADHDDLVDIKKDGSSIEVSIDQITEHAALMEQNIRFIVIKVDKDITDVTAVITQKEGEDYDDNMVTEDVTTEEIGTVG